MNSKLKQTFKRLISGFIAAATAITALPQVTVFAATGTTTYSYDGYDVEYSILGEWNNGQTVEVKVTNTGDDSIMNWAFKYDAEGEISNLWNATVYDCQEEDYVVKNAGWNYEIAPGQTVNFGYTLINDNFIIPEKFELCSKRVEITSGYETSFNVVNRWNTGMNAELVITNTSDEPIEAWTISFDSNFAIDNLWDGRVLDSTDNHYTIASEMWTNPIPSGDSKVIGFTAIIDSGITAEISNCILTEVEIESLEINWEDTTDTDGDGLPDVYERHVFGTDTNNSDTDGDNIPDGYEVITLRTDPTLEDTDGNGITDNVEDFDFDNLTNYEEYLLGTDPYKEDTDGDGLTDADEINVYNTDPLKFDTDGDNILDGDEIFLGLDPNDPTDGDTAVKQTISEEELRVNEYNDNFKISIDVEASNNVKRFITQEVSHYSGMLSDNKSIIGVPINIEYNTGTISNGTITFRFDSKFVNNKSHFYPELELGIERYGIFYYDKEIGTIIPVPSVYDEENSSITIDAKCMGNLMVIDYESLMYDLGVQPETSLYNLPMTIVLMDEESPVCELEENLIESDNTANEITDFEDMSLEEIENILNSYEDENISVFSLSQERSVAKSSAMSQVDLVLVVDTTGSMGSQIYTVKRNLSTLISKLRDDGISLYVSVVDYRDITCDSKKSTKVNNNSGVDFYNSPIDISNAINSLTPYGGGDFEETAIDGLGAAYYLNYRDNSMKYAFLITDAKHKKDNNYGISDMTAMANMLKDSKISTSVITYPAYYDDYNDLTVLTHGEMISMYGNFCDDMYRIISNNTPAVNVVISNNIVSGFFKESLVKGGSCDTDGDTLSDSDEVDWDNVKKVYADGSYELYTWKELCEKRNWLIFKTEYATGELNDLFEIVSSVKVIPAKSNPFSTDTDKDYYPDNVEVNDKSLDVLESNAMFINDEGISDSDFHKGNSIAKPVEDKFTDGVFEIYYQKHDDGNLQERARYSFTRHSDKDVEFSLIPKTTSYYRFKSDIGITDIKITYKGFFWMTESVEPESDGTYLLERGKEYTIGVNNSGYGEYQFTVEQDNWVYAPDGGIWSVTKYSNGSAISNTMCYERIYMPSHRIVSSILQLTDGVTCINIDPSGDIEAQLESVLRNTGMQVTQSELEGAIVAITGATATTISTISAIIAIVIPEPTSSIVGAKQVAKLVVNIIADGCTYWGVPSAIQTLTDYMEQCGFERAFKEGHTNVKAAKYISIGLGNVWDPWSETPYIRKISIMGDVGIVNDNISDQQIIDWCGWELEE